jgi:macrolide transport system ATP-binding/permease protein
METLLQDLRYGLRMLRKNPGFTVVAVITLALGLGANISVFTLISTLLLRPPAAVRDPSSLIDIYAAHHGSSDYSTFSYPDYSYFREHTTVFSELAADYPYSQVNLVANGNSQDVNGSVVSDNYFSLLGLKPALGRFFLAQEQSVPDRNAVAVIGYDLWRREFGSDPAILGSRVKLNGVVFTVVGVGPPDFSSLNARGSAVDVWIPAMMFTTGYRYCNGLQRDCHPVRLIGRLKSGHTKAEAEAELDGLANQLAAQYPQTDRGLAVAMAPLSGVSIRERADAEHIAKLLAAVVSVIVLIVSANLSGLLLARNNARKKEFAFRRAVGARPARLVRQLLLEFFPLSILGCGAGFLVALWAKGIFTSFFGVGDEGRRSYFSISFDSTVIVYSFALAVITTVVFGLTPALQAGRFELIDELKASSATSSRRQTWLGKALVVLQVAFALTLTVSAGLLVRSANNIYAGAGFDPTHVLLFRLRPRFIGYGPDRAMAYQRNVLEKLQSLPGVEFVSPAIYPPLPDWGGQVSAALPGHEPSSQQSALRIHFNEVGEQYFSALKIPILKGRTFNQLDRNDTTPVVVINQTLASMLWPEADALGRSLVLDGRTYQVVGVSQDTQYHAQNERMPPFVYFNYWQDSNWASTPAESRTTVRVKGDVEQMLPVVRRAIQSVDPEVYISEDRPLTDWLRYQFTPVLVARTVVTYSGVLALLLGAIGVYALLAHAVSQRTREIGIRKALGAQTNDVLRLVVGEGVRLTLIGLLLGLAGTLASGSILGAYLYGVTMTDQFTLYAAVVLLGSVALLASYVPARRAVKVDPMVALRYE